MIAGLRLLAQLVVNPALNPEAGDFFPASYSPRIKRLSQYGAANTNIPVIMGAEKISDALLRHH